MTNFEKFKTDFYEKFESVYDFIELSEGRKPELPFGAKLIENGDNVKYDSYGSEESDLMRIFHMGEYDINIMFTGTRCSYDGTEWTNLKEVKQVTKTIKTWE